MLSSNALTGLYLDNGIEASYTVFLTAERLQLFEIQMKPSPSPSNLSTHVEDISFDYEGRPWYCPEGITWSNSERKWALPEISVNPYALVRMTDRISAMLVHSGLVWVYKTPHPDCVILGLQNLEKRFFSVLHEDGSGAVFDWEQEKEQYLRRILQARDLGRTMNEVAAPELWSFAARMSKDDILRYGDISFRQMGTAASIGLVNSHSDLLKVSELF